MRQWRSAMRSYEGRLHGNSFRMGGDNFSFNADTGNSHILSGRRGNRQDSMHGSINKTFGKGIGVYLMGSYNHSINDDDRTSYRESYMLSGNRYSYNVGDDRWRRHGFSLNVSTARSMTRPTSICRARSTTAIREAPPVSARRFSIRIRSWT